jgi:ribosomal-protein-alanine N-acetyltransferase
MFEQFTSWINYTDEEEAVYIRPLGESDLSRVIKIERQSYEFPWPAWIMRQVLRLGYSCWVLVVSGKIAGYGIMRYQDGWCHIMNVCVARRYRSRGYGRKIMGHLLLVARRRDARQVWLEVRPTNEHAIRLYLNMGFKKKTIRKGYYPGRSGRQDGIVMTLHI